MFPAEVEDVLETAPGVAEVAVGGVPDDEWGHGVTAFVVLGDDADPATAARAVLDWARAQPRLARFKRPRRVVVVEQIPKSPVGKVRRTDLVAGHYRLRAEATHAGGATTPA
ncbi:MAG: hypothetical protein AB7V44_20945 [Pseudonocardia sp.]